MSQRDVGRALLALSSGLQQWGGYRAQQERDQAMAMREENLTRLRAQLDAEARTQQQAFLSGESEKDRTARLAEGTADREARRAEAEADRRTRREEGAADRAVRREEIAVTSKRFDREDAANFDAAMLRQLNEIDQRIATLSDMKTKAGLEGQMSDPATLAQVDQQLQQLGQQRAQLSRERDLALARRGDSRYQVISPEEAQRLASAGRKPAASAAEAPAPEAATPAPQPQTGRPSAGTSIKLPRDVPQAPPMDPALAGRLQDRGLIPAAGNGADMGGIQMPQTNPLKFPIQPDLGQINRDLFSGSVADDAIKAIQSGRTPASGDLFALKQIPRTQLLQRGLTEQQLQQLGL